MYAYILCEKQALLLNETNYQHIFILRLNKLGINRLKLMKNKSGEMMKNKSTKRVENVCIFEVRYKLRN